MSRAGDTRPLPAELALAIMTALGVDLASARAYDGRTFGQLWFATATGVLLGVLALLWLRVPRGVVLTAPWIRWIGILPIADATASIYVRGILGAGPLHVLGQIAALGVGVMVLGTVTGRTPILLAGAVASGIALRIFELKVVPIAPARGDMLPLVVLAVTNAARHTSPYHLYHFPWPVPLTYMPLGWLAYAPLLLAGVDPRWTNTLAEFAVLGAVYFAARKREDKTLRNAATALWAFWFVSHRMVKYDAGVAAQAQWAAITWLGALAVEKSRWTPTAFGVALATTPLVLPLAPTLAVAWDRAWRPPSNRPLRARVLRLARAVLVASLVGGVLIVPWVIGSPRGFFDGVVLWFNDIDQFPRAKWAENRAWMVHPSLAGLFWTLHFERWLKPIQCVLIAGLAILYARRLAATGLREALGAELVAVLLVFILFNPMVWAYLWEPGVCLALVTLSSTPIVSEPALPRPKAIRRPEAL
jgi:hypothetical protein